MKMLSLLSLGLCLALTLNACDPPVSPAVTGNQTTHPNQAVTQTGPGSYRWTVMVDNAMAVSQTSTQTTERPISKPTANWRKPLTLQQLHSVEVAGFTILAAQIQTRTQQSSQVAAYQQELQARSAALKQAREAAIRQNAEAAEARRKQAEARYNEQKAAQQQRYQENLAKQSPQPSSALVSPRPAPSASSGFSTQAKTPEPAWRLVYLNNGQFQLESATAPTGPLIVKMRLEGFTEPVTVPLSRESAPVITAARNFQGQTVVTGSFSQIPTPSQSGGPQTGVFTIQPDAEGGQNLDWTSPDGSQHRFDLDTLPASGFADPTQAEALPGVDQDVAAQQFADIDQMFADLERSFSSMPNASDGWANTDWPSDSSASSQQSQESQPSQSSQSDDGFFSD